MVLAQKSILGPSTPLKSCSTVVAGMILVVNFRAPRRFKFTMSNYILQTPYDRKLGNFDQIPGLSVIFRQIQRQIMCKIIDFSVISPKNPRVSTLGYFLIFCLDTNTPGYSDLICSTDLVPPPL